MIAEQAEHLMEVDIGRGRRRRDQACVRLREVVVAELWSFEATLGRSGLLGRVSPCAADVESPAVCGLQAGGARLGESFRIRLAQCLFVHSEQSAEVGCERLEAGVRTWRPGCARQVLR